MKKYILAITIGILVGILTMIGQKYMPMDLNFLVNSSSMWLIFAFLIPYILKTNKKYSIILSISNLIFCVLGYYVFEAIINHHTFEFGRVIIFWLMCAVVGGFVFGLGANYSNTEKNVIKCISMNLLPAVFLSEGLYKLININEYENILINLTLQMIIGFVLYLVINHKESLKKKNLFSILGLVILGIVFFSMLSLV